MDTRFFILCLLLSTTLDVGCQTTAVGPSVIEAQDRKKTLVLGPSDVIEVRIFGEPELSGIHQINGEGHVRLPLVGDLDIDGLSPDHAQSRIQQAYNQEYLKNAQVSVLVKEYNSRRIYVLGQVKAPGNYEYEPRMTVIAAIARAGGVTRLANADATVITRGKGDQQARMSADVNDIQRGHAPDIELLPGDIVFVPESPF